MKERLVYFDVLRGLAMFTVVYSHILLFSLDFDSSSWIISLLRAFFLNAFFFISGYMAYKSVDWNINQTIHYIGKKAQCILIPTLVCGSIFMLTHHVSLAEFIMSGSKCGYWFTYTLFLMFVVYALVMQCCVYIRNDHFRFILLFLIGLVAVPLSRTSLVHGQVQDILTLYNFARYLPLFFLGIICRRYATTFNGKIMDATWVKIGIAFVVLLSFFHPLIAKLSGLFVLFFFYYVVKSLTSKKEYAQSYFVRILSYLGKHTMEIYFLHYFLLFPLPLIIKKYLFYVQTGEPHVLSSCFSFPELLIVGTIALLICFASIALSVILKQIPYVDLLAFGKSNSIKK